MKSCVSLILGVDGLAFVGVSKGVPPGDLLVRISDDGDDEVIVT